MEHRLSDLFLHMEGQFFNLQNDDGSYRPIDIPLSKIPAALAKHLAGEHTLAVRLIQPGTNFVKAGCIDLDLEPNQTIPQLFQLAHQLQSQFRSHGLESYTEFSGRRGIHVWLFAAEVIPAKTIRRAIMHICKACAYDPKEIFPKGDTITDDGKGPGYVPIKLPLGIHKKGTRSYFFKTGFNLDTNDWPTPEVAAATCDEVKGYVRNDTALIARVAALYQEPEKAQTQHTKVSFEGLAEDAHPHCIDFVRKHGAPIGPEYNLSLIHISEPTRPY